MPTLPLFLIEAETERIEAQARDAFSSITFVSAQPGHRAIVSYENGQWLFSTVNPHWGVSSVEISERPTGIALALRSGYQEARWR